MNTAHILPTLTETYHITHRQISDFQNDGHILLQNVARKNEITSYRPIINEAAYTYNTEKRKTAERDTYGKAFLQIMNLWQLDDQVKSFTLAKRFARLAADLLGVEKVRLYHDQALFKESKGGHTPWHQDQYYWPLETTKTITMWMPLVDISEEMGMLTFASGSHKDGMIENLAISDESDWVLDQYIKEKGYPITRPTSMHAGDATFHYGWTLHSAPGNETLITREVMTIIYFAEGTFVTEPKNSHQEDDRVRWLAGLNPGERANSHLNPLME